jgi:hypothetical protein
MSPSQFRVERAGLRLVEGPGEPGLGPASEPQFYLRHPLRDSACLPASRISCDPTQHTCTCWQPAAFAAARALLSTEGSCRVPSMQS